MLTEPEYISCIGSFYGRGALCLNECCLRCISLDVHNTTLPFIKLPVVNQRFFPSPPPQLRLKIGYLYARPIASCERAYTRS